MWVHYALCAVLMACLAVVSFICAWPLWVGIFYFIASWIYSWGAVTNRKASKINLKEGAN